MPVRGWLLLLCFLLTVWNPGTLALVLASAIENVPPPSNVELMLLVLRLVVTGVGVAAGVALWNKRVGAVRLAKVALISFAIEAMGRLSTRTGLSQFPPGTRVPVALAIVAFNGAWFLYLAKSNRVRATYGLG